MYSAGVQLKTWTNDGKATKEFFEAKGATVNKSRLLGDYTVRIEGRAVAYIFNNKADQIAYLQRKGWIK